MVVPCSPPLAVPDDRGPLRRGKRDRPPSPWQPSARSSHRKAPNSLSAAPRHTPPRLPSMCLPTLPCEVVMESGLQIGENIYLFVYIFSKANRKCRQASLLRLLQPRLLRRTLTKLQLLPRIHESPAHRSPEKRFEVH